MNDRIARLGIAAGLFLAIPAWAEITLYEHDGFRGRSFTVTEEVRNLQRHGFNDLASSVYVTAGRWEVCTDAQFRGECKVLRRGSYDSLRGMGINDKISSLREVNAPRPGAEARPTSSEPGYAYYRRPREQVFEARVISVRKVFGEGERRCWTEAQPDSGQASGRNVGAAVVGALIGGVLAHQVGKGRGQSAATAAGAVAGAAIGSRAGGVENTYQRQVQRCATVASDRPAFWDVVYEFDDQEYHAQMSHAPGPTILVNQHGEPRQ